MQGSDCAGVLVLAPARQGIPWTYVEEGRNPPLQGSMQNFPFCSVQRAVHILFSQNCTQHKNNIWDSPFNAHIVTLSHIAQTHVDSSVYNVSCLRSKLFSSTKVVTYVVRCI